MILVQPNLAALEWGAVQVQGDSRCARGRIPDLVVADTVVDKDAAALVEGLVVRANQLAVDAVDLLSVTAFLYLPLQDAHPATITGMIMNRAKLPWIPAQ